MRKFISIIVIALTMGATPSFAGGSSFFFGMSSDGSFVAGFGTDNRQPYYQHHASRERGLYRYRLVQPRYGRVDNHRRYEQRPPRGSWRIRSGDYCAGHMYYYRDRYYCGR